MNPIRFPLRTTGTLLAATLLAAGLRLAAPARAAPGTAAGATPGGTAGAAADPVRTVAADRQGTTFEYVAPAARFDTVSVEGRVYARVTLPGAIVSEPAGRPALPTVSIPFGVPDGMSPRLRVVSEEWDTHAAPPPIPVPFQRYVNDDPKTGPESEVRYDQDAAIYAGAATFPPEAATLAEGAPMGEMWTAAALVHPVRFEPRAGTYRVLRRIVVRIDFAAAGDRERASRPAFRPDAEASVWKRIQQSTLRNYAAARAFPRRAARAPAPPRAPRRLGQGNPEFKITVTKTGWSSVSYAALASAGFPAGVPIAQIGIWVRGYDDTANVPTATPIPVAATDANANGAFDAGDRLAFYAQSLRDRLGAGSIENRYGYANVYWLTWTAAPAAAVDSINGAIPTPTPELPTWFHDTIHLEQNQFLLASPSTTAGAPPENVEHFFWTHGDEPDDFSTPLSFADADGAQAIRVTARYQGRNGPVHRLSIFFDGSGGVTDTLAFQQTFLNQDVYVLDTGFTLPGSLIGSGTGQYRHAGDRQISGGPFTAGSWAWLDWIDVTYAHKYVASGNVLAFTSGTIGAVGEVHVGGFTASGAGVFDVTDPAAPRRVTAVRDSLLPGGSHEVSFRCDASAGERRYVAALPGAETAITPGAIVQDAPSALTVPSSYPAGSQARAIIITPTAFLAPVTRLADFRRGQGYVVEVATIEDVYDEWSGGLKSALAIRRYFEYAYQNWTPRPTFALLAGDASMDYRHDLPQSSVDWIPTYLDFETIPGPQGVELVARDAFYVLNLANSSAGVSQFVPSIFLGRAPAGSTGELNAYVDKVIQYEQFAPTDTWRGRQLLVSDDQYSTSIFFTGNYCLHPEEGLFHDTNQSVADIAAASQSGQDIRSDFWDLKTYTDAVPTYVDPFGQTCRTFSSVITEVGKMGGACQQLIGQVAQGGLILNVQAHANRYLIAHEQIFCVPSPFCASLFGPDQLANDGKPYLFMVWGCHANQFADGPLVGSGTVDSTDAVGEQWVLRPSGGSIASLGSSAFELLNTNAALNGYVADAIYTAPPAPVQNPGDPRLGRWILGEIWAKALTRNAQSGDLLQQVMSYTMNLLGDPMLHMDALPPRIFQVALNGTPVSDGAALVSDSPTDSIGLVANVRDEVTIAKTDLAERLLPGGAIVPLPPALFRVTQGDTGRADTLTARVRPRASNYDLLVRAFDVNGRERDFSLQVRTAVRYTADGKDILNGEFVGESAVLRAEVTAPVPVLADSLELLVDGVPIVVTKTQTDAAGRRWTLQSLPEARGPGSHEMRISIGGRSAEFDPVGFRVDTSFRILHVAVLSASIPMTGCDGTVFQYELTAPASTVRLLVHTIAGRRVAALDWPGVTGNNVRCWDGRDSEGHELARGVYFYRLTATDPSGRTMMQTGRMIHAPR